MNNQSIKNSLHNNKIGAVSNWKPYQKQNVDVICTKPVAEKPRIKNTNPISKKIKTSSQPNKPVDIINDDNQLEWIVDEYALYHRNLKFLKYASAKRIDGGISHTYFIYAGKDETFRLGIVVFGVQDWIERTHHQTYSMVEEAETSVNNHYSSYLTSIKNQ